MATRPESVDPCEVGDHYACERTRCRCTCHPRGLARRRPVVEDLPQTQMRGATWQPEDAA